MICVKQAQSKVTCNLGQAVVIKLELVSKDLSFNFFNVGVCIDDVTYLKCSAR